MIKSLANKARGTPPEPTETKKGGTDLLLRFFQSQFFNEWIAIQ